MDWSLLAGGLSRAMDQANQGLGQGLLAGEQIRHGRAQEGIQQQRLGMQQQQLQNMNQWRQMQGDIASQRLGIEAQRAAAEEAYKRGMLGYHGGQLEQGAERNRLFGERTGVMGQHYDQLGKNFESQDALRKARIKALEANPLGAGGRGTESERYRHSAAQRLGFQNYYDPEMPEHIRTAIDRQFSESRPFGPQRIERYGDLHQHTQLMDQNLQNLIANPNASALEKATTAEIAFKLKAYESAMFRISRDQGAGLPPNPADLQLTQTINPQQLFQDMATLKGQIEARGLRQSGQPPAAAPQPGAAKPPQGADAVRQKWGLR